MVPWRSWLGKFWRDEDGPTALENAVIVALIVVVCLGTVATLGGNSRLGFNKVGKSISVVAKKPKP
jgi:pilus assembly protein Flp/PilA